MYNNALAIMLTSLLLCACAGTNKENIANTNFPNWKLVYHHKQDGVPITGNKQQLIGLIQSGHSVRIVWPLRKDFVHITNAGFLTVMNGEIFAQAPDIIRQIPQLGEFASIALDAEDQSHWHSIFSTTGQMQSFQSVNSQLLSRQVTLKWYVFY